MPPKICRVFNNAQLSENDRRNMNFRAVCVPCGTRFDQHGRPITSEGNGIQRLKTTCCAPDVPMQSVFHNGPMAHNSGKQHKEVVAQAREAKGFAFGSFLAQLVSISIVAGSTNPRGPWSYAAAITAIALNILSSFARNTKAYNSLRQCIWAFCTDPICSPSTESYGSFMYCDLCTAEYDLAHRCVLDPQPRPREVAQADYCNGHDHVGHLGLMGGDRLEEIQASADKTKSLSFFATILQAVASVYLSGTAAEQRVVVSLYIVAAFMSLLSVTGVSLVFKKGDPLAYLFAEQPVEVLWRTDQPAIGAAVENPMSGMELV